MEKIKSLLNPGHQKDDETLYGAHSASKHPENQSLSSHAGPTSTLENATAGTLPTSADPDTQYSRDATTAEGAGATGLGSEHHNSSGVPASNTEIYGPALTHSTHKNEPTSALSAAGLSSVTPATNSAYPDSLSTAQNTTNPTAVPSLVTPATNSAYPDSLSTAQSSINPIGSPEHDSHFGRDAAIAGGAGVTGLGASEASKHHGHTSSTPASQSTSNDGYGSAKILGTTTTGSTVRSEASAPGATGTAPGQSIGSTSSTYHDSHNGRDAALVGGVGAAGLGAYEAKKHHDNSSGSQPIHQSTSQQLGPGAALGTGSRDVSSGSGISSSTTASRPDATSFASNASIKSGILGKVPTSEMSKSAADLPAAPASGGKFTEGTFTTSAYPTQTPSQSAGDRAFPLAGGQTSGSANPSSTSHAGRDAAIVGSTGLAGVGASEAWKRHENNDAPKSATDAARNVADGRQARPGAWAAVTDNDSREEPAEWRDHSHGGIGHEYKGDPCGATEDNTSSGSGLPPQGPHQTQAANLLDPSIRHDSISHMPGTFPRFESDMTVPSYGGAQTEAGSDPVRRADNIVGSHDTSSYDRHLGRDAAVAGGISAAGLGAYEASKKHDNTVSGFGTQSSSTTGPTAVGGPFSSSTTTAPNTGLAATDAKFHDEKDSHTGRNLALGGGTAAAGLGGYEAYKHHENQQPTIPPPTTAASSLPAHSTASGTTDAPYSSTTAVPSTGETASKLRDSHDSHTGRNVALGGGAAAAGLGGYEAFKDYDHKDNISGLTPAGTSVRNDGVPISGQQSTLTHNQKENVPTTSTATDDKHHTGRDVAAVGAAGAAGAGAHHEYSKHEAEKNAKEQQKAEEKLAKEREHEAAKRHKEHEKEVKQHEKDAAKHEKEFEKEKKPSLFSRLLHRKKDKHGNEVDSEEEDRKHGYDKEAALGSGTVGAADVSVAEHDGHNKLHKDPPIGHPAHDANARSTRTYFTTAAGPTLEERAEAEAAGTSTAGTAHIPAEGHSSSHGTHGNSQSEGIVTDPHTGLPMNVSKYGDGHGGTDGNPAIHGANTHGGAASDVKATDWEAIKKANTPY